jgi:hypothetical protein
MSQVELVEREFGFFCFRCGKDYGEEREALVLCSRLHTVCRGCLEALGGEKERGEGEEGVVVECLECGEKVKKDKAKKCGFVEELKATAAESA